LRSVAGEDEFATVVLTGGDAGLVWPHMDNVNWQPSLVFQGIAWACP